MSIETKFAERLTTIRKSLGFNKGDFASELGISSTAFYKIEQGINKPCHDFFESIAGRFNVNLHYLLLGIGSMFRDEKKDELITGIFEDTALKSADVEKFLTYFRHSEYLQHSLIAVFKNALTEKGMAIEKEVSESKRKSAKP